MENKIVHFNEDTVNELRERLNRGKIYLFINLLIARMLIKLIMATSTNYLMILVLRFLSLFMKSKYLNIATNLKLVILDFCKSSFYLLDMYIECFKMRGLWAMVN